MSMNNNPHPMIKKKEVSVEKELKKLVHKHTYQGRLNVFSLADEILRIIGHPGIEMP